MFKIGEKVIVNNKAENKKLIGNAFIFLGYLRDSRKIGNINVDCIVGSPGGSLFFSSSEKLDKSYDYSYNGTTVKVEKNIVIVKLVKDGKEYIGIAKCSPEDKFDLRTGFDIALARCENQFFNEIALKIDGEYPKRAIPINTIVKITNAGETYCGGDEYNVYLKDAISKGTINKEFEKYYTKNGKEKYYRMFGSRHPVENVRFIVRGVSTLYNKRVYMIQELDTKEHEITVIDEEGIDIGK